MSLRSKLTDLGSPQEALLFLADRVEQLEDRIAELEDGPAESDWSTWGDVPPQEEWSPDPAVEKELAEAREALKGNEDPEESKALRATIFLLEDELRPPQEDGVDLDQNRTTQITDESGAVLIEVPTVDEETEEIREKFARDVLCLTDAYGDEPGEAYIRAYRKGGPLVIYYTDRDFVMGLSDDVKQAMVKDVLELSPQEAHEMGRDILKDLDPGGPDVSVENLIKTMGHG